jgi:hypothetical protein
MIEWSFLTADDVGFMCLLIAHHHKVMQMVKNGGVN